MAYLPQEISLALPDKTVMYNLQQLRSLYVLLVEQAVRIHSLKKALGVLHGIEGGFEYHQTSKRSAARASAP